MHPGLSKTIMVVLLETNAPQARFIGKNAPQARIFDEVLMGTLSYIYII